MLDPNHAQAIAEASATLDAIDDRIGAAIAAVEEFLRARVGVLLDEPCTDPRFQALCWSKRDGVWALWLDVVSTPGDMIQLSRSSREIRASVLASGALERLLQNAVKHISALVASRDPALAGVNRVLALIGWKETP